jgi:Asp-tRNA(Asn)/Glu-tRNA(Gln) amidotransferase A subunit family amidase
MSTHDRRAFLAYFSSLGLGATLLPGILWAQAAQGVPITREAIASAESLAGLRFTDEQRDMMAANLRNLRGAAEQLRRIPLDNAVPPAIVFDPLPPGRTLPARRKVPMVRSAVPVMARPGSLEELAYQPVTVLSELVRTRRVKPSELTAMYLGRLRRYDPQLFAVITLTEERAVAQARAADADIAAGRYRGPLHGIPWGAKDLLAVKGYRTTWGAGPYREQVLDYDAEVVKRLDAAGAILVAKLTMGELAQGDRWYGERTRNPWNPASGSSGSSAGPGSATAAGLVAFSIGTETQGSISSPSRINGVSGHRPTFGRVPRTGAMALSWTMDKIGPMCRSAEDCALVFDAIAGPDNHDRAVRDYPFNWNGRVRGADLRVGYFPAAFERRAQDGTVTRNDMASAVLDVLRRQGMRLVEKEAPTFALSSSLVLNPEAGAAFQELTLSGKVDEMVQQAAGAWPNTFRAAQFVAATDYINANRARTLLCQQWWELFADVDVIVTPSEPLSTTNLTGNPAVIVPNGFTQAAGGDAAAQRQVPSSITFIGGLFRDEQALAAAHLYQSATDFHRRVPPGFA